MSQEMNWDGANRDPSVVIPSVRGVAVYTNPGGSIVIRQEGSGVGDEPDDDYVVIPRAMVKQLVKALQDELKKPL